MITGYFGLPASGKSTVLTSIAQKELRKIRKGKSKYDIVCTNYYCQDCVKIDYQMLGNYKLQNALVLLDELTLDADSRNFKQFNQVKKEFFMQHRKDNVDVIYFTQAWDGIDKKIRDLTYSLYFAYQPFANVKGIIFKPFQQFTIARRIFRKLDINEYTNEIVLGYRFATTFERWFGRGIKKFVWRPSWYKYFDTFEAHYTNSRLPFVPVLWVKEDKIIDYLNDCDEVNNTVDDSGDLSENQVETE